MSVMLCLWTPLGALTPDPRYGLVHPTVFDLATPLIAFMPFSWAGNMHQRWVHDIFLYLISLFKRKIRYQQKEKKTNKQT